MIHEIVPRERIGDVYFGKPVELLLDLGYREDVDDFDERLNWRKFTRNEGLDCYVKDGEVICIACYFKAVYLGYEIIGISQKEVVAIFGEPDEVGETLSTVRGTEETPYEYAEKGLQIWLNLGKVVSVFANDVSD